LYRVNTATGALTLIGSGSAPYYLFGSTTSGLYGLSQEGDIYSVNPATGATTLIGATGISLVGSWFGMSEGGSRLFISSSTSLYSINTSTGGGTLVGSISPAQLGAMLDAYGAWWGGNDEGPSQVFTFNPSTAAITAGSLVTSAPSNFWGLAVVPVPEPSTWAMMALGFAGLSFAGYRRARLAVAIS
jgi:hypothetical protein